jgi:prolyl oligopeptidase PreP (S9A serine peptidase family)
MAAIGDDTIVFANESYVDARQWLAFDADTGSTRKLDISSTSPIDYSDVEVVREFATSEDGTRVPVNILVPKGMPRDGTGAILVTGYGVKYPPVLLAAGANDPRVNPMHSRKFAARLEQAEGGSGVVLLRTSAGTGHGPGTPLSETIDLTSDQYAFIFHYLKVPVALLSAPGDS